MADESTAKWAEQEINRVRADKDREIERLTKAWAGAADERDRNRSKIEELELQVYSIREECAKAAEGFKIGIITREDLPKYIAAHVRVAIDQGKPLDVLEYEDSAFEKATHMKDCHISVQEFDEASVLRDILNIARKAVTMLEKRGLAKAKK